MTCCLYNLLMLRLFRSAIFWLAMVATALNGMVAHAAVSSGSAPNGAGDLTTSAVAMATASSLQNIVTSEFGAIGDASVCAGDMDCADFSTDHCLTTLLCQPVAAEVAAPMAFLAPAVAAPPLVSPSDRAGRFLTGALDRPPRQPA